MDSFLTEHLEDFLGGRLTERKRLEFEARLERDPAAAKEVALHRRTADLFAALRLDEDDPIEPAPGFYARVNQAIEEEKEVPFWMVFLQPFMVRRLAFASLMWLLMLGSVTVLNDNRTERNTHLAEIILNEQPPTEHYFVRLGTDLERNRATMLSVMMAGE